MTPADIRQLAAQHGMALDPTTPLSDSLDIAFKLGAHIEREACVQIVHKRTGIPEDAIRRGTGVRDHLVVAGEQIIEAIRARSTL